jgi:hypothetical protein
MKRFVKFAFGLLSLLIGTGILLWCAYSLFVPNQYFRWRVVDIPRLAVPLAMLWLGLRWIRRSPVKAQRYASELTVTVKLSDSDFGGEPERSSILALKHRLEDKLQENRLGEIDGEEYGGGECSLFVQTNTPGEAETLIRSFFRLEAPSLAYSVSMVQL